MFGNPVNKNSFMGIGKCQQCSKQCQKYLFHDKLYLQTPSYYRNKSSGHYYFCAEECRDTYRDKNTCYQCGYGSGLQEYQGKQYCTSNPMSGYSCLAKVTNSNEYLEYVYEKQLNLEEHLKKMQKQLNKVLQKYENSKIMQKKVSRINNLIQQIREQCTNFDQQQQQEQKKQQEQKEQEKQQEQYKQQKQQQQKDCKQKEQQK